MEQWLNAWWEGFVLAAIAWALARPRLLDAGGRYRVWCAALAGLALLLPVAALGVRPPGLLPSWAQPATQPSAGRPRLLTRRVERLLRGGVLQLAGARSVASLATLAIAIGAIIAGGVVPPVFGVGEPAQRSVAAAHIAGPGGRVPSVPAAPRSRTA